MSLRRVIRQLALEIALVVVLIAMGAVTYLYR
jgi:hypothetical protein